MSRILVPNRELVVPGPGLAGFYKFEAVGIDAYGQEKYRRVVADWFPNLITDAGLNAIGTANTIGFASQYTSGTTVPCAICKVGAGTATPTVLDSALQAYIASANTLQFSTTVEGGAPNYYVGFRNIFRFNVGVAAGNLSEVGMGNTIGNTGILFSRALILDGSGNPTTITILATEVLDVTYELRSYAPLVDGSGSFVISGVTYNYAKRAARAGSSASSDMRSTSPSTMGLQTWSGGLGAITTAPLGGSASGTNTVLAYSNNSLVRDGTMSFTLDQSNFPIAGLLIFAGLGQMQFGLTPSIPKDSTKVMTLNYRFGPWGRYTPP